MQLVLIDTGTLNILINETYDVVAIHEDDVELSHSGYATFRVITITGITKGQIDEIFNAKIPETGIAYKTISKPSKWSFIKPAEGDVEQEKEVWLNTDAKWYFMEDRPKYSIGIPVSVSNIDDLDNITIPVNVKIQLINSVAREKIHLKAINMTEARDLN